MKLHAPPWMFGSWRLILSRNWAEDAKQVAPPEPEKDRDTMPNHGVVVESNKCAVCKQGKGQWHNATCSFALWKAGMGKGRS